MKKQLEEALQEVCIVVEVTGHRMQCKMFEYIYFSLLESFYSA